jgi:hypothetical protein
MGKKILSQLEEVAFWLQKKYMASRQTTEIVEKGRVFFHPQDCSRRVMLEYQRRLRRLKIK